MTVLKFSIVTPSFNSGRFIEETIKSVVEQKGNFNIEYIIVDNCSTDETKEIVIRYQDGIRAGQILYQCNSVVLKYINEKDTGMYDAINKGFSHATGDIYAWINADDIYLPGAFDIINKIFEAHSQVTWVKGIGSYINESSTIYKAGHCLLYQQEWLRHGLYGPILNFIQQNTVFWRSDLWEKSGGVDSNCKMSGDYFLWIEFSKLAPLYSLSAFVSCFRKIKGQKSEAIEEYWKEISKYGGISRHDRDNYKLLRKYFSKEHIIPKKFREIIFKIIFGDKKYYLITLDNSIEPSIKEGSYYELKEALSRHNV